MYLCFASVMIKKYYKYSMFRPYVIYTYKININREKYLTQIIRANFHIEKISSISGKDNRFDYLLLIREYMRIYIKEDRPGRRAHQRRSARVCCGSHHTSVCMWCTKHYITHKYLISYNVCTHRMA